MQVSSNKLDTGRRFDWLAVLRAYLPFLYLSCLTPLLIMVRTGDSFVPVRQGLLLSLLWLVPVLIFAQRARLVAGIACALLWATSLLGLGYFFIYRQEFSQSVMFIIFESNPAESKEYMAQYFVWWMIPAFLAHAAVTYLLWRQVRNFAVRPLHAGLAVVAICAGTLAYPMFKQMVVREARADTAVFEVGNRFQRVTPWDLGIGFYRYRTILGNMQALLAQSAQMPPLENLTDANGDEPRTLVLVIGESTNRQHMSLYGYPRKTSPGLEAMRDRLQVFNNVVSSRPYTIEVLQQVLTFADQEHPDLYLSKPSIMNMMKQAGYKSYWITNQQTMTERNTMLTTFAKQTDVQVYLNHRASQDSSQYDSAVFEPFAEALKDPAPKKFIVVHLLGAHMKYRYRYPADYERFTDRTDTPAWLQDSQLLSYNQYDNALLFNDHVVKTLIDTFAATKPNGFLLYFADHGEDVFDTEPHDFNGRNEHAPTYAMYAVPFLMWSSEQWQASRGVVRGDVLDRQYSTMHFIHTWADLAGLRFDGFDPTRSLVNDKFVERPLWVGDPDTPKAFKDLRSMTRTASSR